MSGRGRFTGAILAVAIAMAMMLAPGMRGAVAQATPEASPAASPVAGGGVAAAVQWLIGQQNDDGSFVGFSGTPDAGTTVDALTALAAAKESGVDVGDAIDMGMSYLETGDTALVYTQTGVGQAAKLALLLVAVGIAPADFAHVTPILIVQHGRNAETGIYGGGFFDHALAILALTATGSEVPDSALDALQQGQAANGGWAFDGTTDDANVDSNTTALVLQALAAMGEQESDLATRGAAYLQATVTEGGASYNAAEGSLPDANSTALAIQGLLAVGKDVTTLNAALATFQNPDGSFFYQAGMEDPNLLATVQAIPAQAGVILPIVPAPASAGAVLPLPSAVTLAA